MFDWAADLDLGALEHRGTSSDLERHFFLHQTLLDERLIDGQDLGQVRLPDLLVFLILSGGIHGRCRGIASRCRSRGAGRRCRVRRAAANFARVTGFRFSGFRRRVAMIGRFRQNLSQGQQLLAGHLSYTEASVTG